MSVLQWNIRGIGTTTSIEYLKMMISHHKPFIVEILEPKQSMNRVAGLATTLGFSNFFHGHRTKYHIWIFWNVEVEVSYFQAQSQLIYFSVKHHGEQAIRMSFVYAKCTRNEHDELLGR